MDNAPIKPGKSITFRCRECLVGFRRDSMYRTCGFHPRTHSFHANNAGCSTLAKLRWILMGRGVPLMHPELSGSVSAYTMGLDDGRRLTGVWIKARTRTTLMCLYDGGDCVALDLDTAEQIIRDYSPELTESAENLSVGWTR